MLLDRRSFAFYRDEQGRSSIHLAIERLNFGIALYLVEKYPSLSKINDCVSQQHTIIALFNFKLNSILTFKFFIYLQQGRHTIDYLEAVDKSTLNEAQQEEYDRLSEILKA